MRTPCWRNDVSPSGQLPSMDTSFPEPARWATNRHASAPVPTISNPIISSHRVVMDNKTRTFLCKPFLQAFPFILVHVHYMLWSRKSFAPYFCFIFTECSAHLSREIRISLNKL